MLQVSAGRRVRRIQSISSITEPSKTNREDAMKRINRREFVAHTLVGGGAVWAGLSGIPSLLAAAPTKKEAADQVLLGTTGIRLSRLAMGSGTNGVNHSSDQSRLGIKGFSDLLCYGFDHGINFWESADQY